MALTTNQQKILEEALREKFGEDAGGLFAFMADLMNRPQPQVIARLKIFAARRRDKETQRLADYDANRQSIVDSIAFYTTEAL